MNFWNFIHGTLGIHMYELFAIVLLAAVLISAIVHTVKEKLADETNNAADNQMSAAQDKEKGE